MRHFELSQETFAWSKSSGRHDYTCCQPQGETPSSVSSRRLKYDLVRCFYQSIQEVMLMLVAKDNGRVNVNTDSSTPSTDKEAASL